MVIYEEIPINSLKSQAYLSENVLYFDIETTGLSWHTSHLTVIGAAYRKGELLRVVQYFADRPDREEALLTDFSALAAPFDTVAHFNGATFDIGYVAGKCSFYGLPDPFEGKASLDLYRYCRGCKDLFGLENLKQKSLEKLFSFPRKDTISGADCITCYRDFVAFGDTAARDAILLHNKEDVVGLCELTGLLAFDAFRNGAFTVASAAAKQGGLVLRLALEQPLPFLLRRQKGVYSLDARGEEAVLTAAGVSSTLYYYFSHYRDYFYLPEEDRAVHKSVGIYVDPAYRVKATAATAYEKISGFFIYQPCAIIEPCFRPDRSSKLTLFPAEKLPRPEDPVWKRYTAEVIKTLMKKEPGGKANV